MSRFSKRNLPLPVKAPETFPAAGNLAPEKSVPLSSRPSPVTKRVTQSPAPSPTKNVAKTPTATPRASIIKKGKTETTPRVVSPPAETAGGVTAATGSSPTKEAVSVREEKETKTPPSSVSSGTPRESVIRPTTITSPISPVSGGKPLPPKSAAVTSPPLEVKVPPAETARRAPLRKLPQATKEEKEAPIASPVSPPEEKKSPEEKKVPRKAPKAKPAPKVSPTKRVVNYEPVFRDPETGQQMRAQFATDVRHSQTHGVVFRNYFKYHGLAQGPINLFDKFLLHNFPKYIMDQKIKHKSGEVVEITNVFVDKPTYPTGTKTLPLYPLNAKRRNLNYSGAIRYMIKTPDGKEKMVSGGLIPIMLYSQFCNLHGLAARHLIALGENPDDPGGYFTQAGREQVIIFQEQMRMNQVVTYLQKGKKDKDPEVKTRITVKSPKGTSVVNEVSFGVLGDLRISLQSVKTKTRTNTQGKIGVLQLLRFLGISPEEFPKLLEQFLSGKDDPAALQELYVSYHKLSARTSFSEEEEKERRAAVGENEEENEEGNIDQQDDDSKEEKLNFNEDVLYLASKLGLNALEGPDPSYVYGLKKKLVLDMIRDDLFPHIVGAEKDVTLRKIFLLCEMVAKQLETKVGVRKPDDRDNWSVKCIRSAAPMMEQLARALIRKQFRKITESINTTETLNIGNVARAFENTKSIFTDGFFQSFNTGMWGAKAMKNVKTNVVQPLNRKSYIAFLSHLQRTTVDASPNDPNPNLRSNQGSALIAIDPAETPENETCGQTKNIGISTTPSFGVSEAGTILLLEQAGVISYSSTPGHNTTLKVGGAPLGWCDGRKVKKLLLNFRRSGKIPQHAEIVFDGKTLEVFTEDDRAVFPLLVVGENQKLELLNQGLSWDTPFETLLAKGAAEYVGTAEQSYIRLAASIDDLYIRQVQFNKLITDLQSLKAQVKDLEDEQKRRQEKENREEEDSDSEEEEERLEGSNALNRKISELNEQIVAVRREANTKAKNPFTHCLLDPVQIAGIATGSIPFPEHIQAPRAVYQVSMFRQAMGDAGPLHTFEGETKLLMTPQEPIFVSDVNEVIGLDDRPQGEMVLIAIDIHGGKTQEDAFIFDKTQIDIGKFMEEKRISVSAVFQKHHGNVTEKLKRPRARPGEPPGRYDAINANGLPTIGATIVGGQCVIGKVTYTSKEGVKEEKNESVYLKPGEEGIVQDILVSEREEVQSVSVVLSVLRSPIVGNKFAPRFAQKGTISTMEEGINMPTIMSGPLKGRRPTVIINTHGQPGRMTETYKIEMYLSLLGAIKGVRMDATAFRGWDFEKAQAQLAGAGYERYGDFEVFDGATGERKLARIFMGYVQMQGLIHHAQDKIQARGRGAHKVSTRQPVHGRDKGGGPRVGEMERDSLIEHGAAGMLNDFLCQQSDKIIVPKCDNCGVVAGVNNAFKFTCKNCKEGAKFSRVTMPFSLNSYQKILAAAGMFQRTKGLHEKEYLELKGFTPEEVNLLREEDQREEEVELGELENDVVREFDKESGGGARKDADGDNYEDLGAEEDNDDVGLD